MIKQVMMNSRMLRPVNPKKSQRMMMMMMMMGILLIEDLTMVMY